MSVFKARYPGTCAACGQRFMAGERISWSRRGTKRTYHAECAQRSTNATETDPLPRSDNEHQSEPKPEPTGETSGGASDGLGAVIAAAIEPHLRAKADASVFDKVRERLDSIENKASEALRLVQETPKEATVRVTVSYRRADGETRTLQGTHKQMPTLLRLASLRENVYLYGPPGGGKSFAAAQVAEAMSIDFAYASLNPGTPESRLLGFVDAMGTYRETPFYRWFRDGGVFCLDELDNAHPALLNSLNSLLENGLGAFPCGMTKRHEDAIIIATGNTPGRGGDIDFVERRAFDPAFLDRFISVQWEIDENLEARLVGAASTDATVGEAWLAWARKLRAAAQQRHSGLFVTPRGVAKGARLLAEGWLVAEAADMALFKGLDRASKDALLGDAPLPTIYISTEDA